MSTPALEQLYEAIQALPMRDRLRLVERVVHSVVEEGAREAPAPSLLGLFRDEPEVVDQALSASLELRRGAKLRSFDE
jgi:hypothetical protein